MLRQEEYSTPPNEAEDALSLTHVYDHGPLSQQVAQELQVLQARESDAGEQGISTASDVTLATQGTMLDIVASNTCAKVATRLQPVLTKEGYTTSPSCSTLAAMNAEELGAITDFKIQRTVWVCKSRHHVSNNHVCSAECWIVVGSLKWQVPVDLRGANLDSVDISESGATVDKCQLPMLDCACQVVAEQLFPKPGASAKKCLRFAKKLQAHVESLGHHFENYDAETGVLRFQVEHFSRLSVELQTR
jgi:hypothetical protein